MMIPTPNRVGRATSAEASSAWRNRSANSGARPSRRCSSAKRRMMFSTITTAPSTMIPKSMAPRLSRFALIRPCTMPEVARSIESGITSATMSAPARLPSSSSRSAITSAAPVTRFVRTVSSVAFTSLPRL